MLCKQHVTRVIVWRPVLEAILVFCVRQDPIQQVGTGNRNKSQIKGPIFSLHNAFILTKNTTRKQQQQQLQQQQQQNNDDDNNYAQIKVRECANTETATAFPTSVVLLISIFEYIFLLGTSQSMPRKQQHVSHEIDHQQAWLRLNRLTEICCSSNDI